MKRIFGASKPQQPAVSLEEATKKVDDRSTGLEEKIKKLDAELIQYREKMKKTKPGPARNALQQKAVRILKQKKMYEQQRDQLMSQSFNMEQANFATQSLKDTVTTVSAMKQANTSIKQQLKSISIDEVENLQDDMADLLETSNEIQESLSRSYATPDFDDSELEDELAALGEEISVDDTPSYLLASAPSNDPLVLEADQRQPVKI